MTKRIIFKNIFSKKQTSDPNVKLVINNKLINQVTAITFWGVLLQQDLSWKCQIQHVERKVGIGILCKAKSILDKASLFLLYCSLILPYLKYCSKYGGTQIHPD